MLVTSQHDNDFIISGRYKYICTEESKGTFYIALELTSPQAGDGATYKLNAKNANGESNANLSLNFDGMLYYRVLEFSEIHDRWYAAERMHDRSDAVQIFGDLPRRSPRKNVSHRRPFRFAENAAHQAKRAEDYGDVGNAGEPEIPGLF